MARREGKFPATCFNNPVRVDVSMLRESAKILLKKMNEMEMETEWDESVTNVSDT